MVLAVAACGGYTPASPEALLDELEEAGVLTCRERRSPAEGIATCESDDGDLTVGLTGDPAGAIRSTRESAGGPWIVGGDWIVISYDNDLDRLREIRDTIGHGDLYQDIDEVPVEVD